MSRRGPTWHRVIWVSVVFAALVGCSGNNPPAGRAQPAPSAVPVIQPVVLAEIPHDASAFTQGFELDGQTLYEGTGLVGKSQVRELDPATGSVRRAVATQPSYFGEGITVVDDRIWELTWRDGIAVEWDKATLTPRREVPMDGEGWGVCRDGDRLIRSDGTDRLRFHDPVTFAETGSVSVTHDGQPVSHLNELECVDGQVWANVWPSDTIVRIDPASGAVTTIVDAGGLWRGPGRTPQNVLNGIAHVGGQEFLLTGKNWPTMYRVRLDTPT